MFKFMQILFTVVAFVAAIPVFAQTYANEATDYGVKPTTELTTTYHAKTPTTVPGAKTISTVELKAMLDGPNPPLLFDVLGGSNRVVIPGAILLGFPAGDGNVNGEKEDRFAKMLATVTNGNKDRAIVFYCLSVECWLSYNSSLRAVGERYTNVLWYRGGFNAWKAAGYPFVGAQSYAW